MLTLSDEGAPTKFRGIAEVQYAIITKVVRVRIAAFGALGLPRQQRARLNFRLLYQQDGVRVTP